jgi:hypothetical protein
MQQSGTAKTPRLTSIQVGSNRRFGESGPQFVARFWNSQGRETRKSEQARWRVKMRLGRQPRKVRSFFRLFLGTFSRRGPLQGDCPFLIWLGNICRSSARVRFRLDGIGNANIPATFSTLNDETGPRFVYHHVVVARRTGKANIHLATLLLSTRWVNASPTGVCTARKFAGTMRHHGRPLDAL